MFSLFGRKKSKEIEPLSERQLKEITKVLIIDDEEPEELRALLKKEGWKNSYLNDLDALSNKKLVDSHVVCIDIMGVGKALQEKNGIGLVKHIKERYPEKKVILYSSVSDHDIFEDALDYVDVRIRKQSSLVPFIQAIENMAKSTLSLDAALEYAYGKIETMAPGLTYEKFRKQAEKSIVNGSFDSEKFANNLGIAANAASLVAALLGFISLG